MWRIPMKKLLLATAIAALSVSAQAAPTVYGKAYLSVDYTDTNANGKETKLNSNSSRIGVKGAEALTANTDLVYQLEYKVDIDNEKGEQFKPRDTFLGLSNKQYGTFLAGRLSAIDDQIDYADVTEGGIPGGSDTLASFGENRLDNAFAYISPNYTGLNFMAMYQTDGSDDTGSLPNGGWGVGAKYEPNGQPYRGGVTYIQAGDLKSTRVSGAFDVNPALTVAALYQVNDKLATLGTAGLSNAKKENVLAVSATYKTATPWTAYGQYDFAKNHKGQANNDVNRITVGGKYKFNSATTGHVYVSGLEPETGDTELGIGTGLEYNF